jgi:hypothetical protein
MAQSSIEIMIARDGPNKLGAANRIIDDKPLSSIFTQEQLQEKNPQYIVDPDDHKFKVSDESDQILKRLSYFPNGLKTFNYANLIHTVTKNHTEKQVWTELQHLTETGYKRLESFVPERCNEPLFTPVVKRRPCTKDDFLLLTCKLGPWKNEEDQTGKDILEFKLQVAFGDDKDFIKTNPVWIDWRCTPEKDNTLVFPIGPDVSDTAYIAIRVQAVPVSEQLRDSATSWSDPSAVFKKSFFD